ncbi:hypothetical protein NUW54_g9289 [Trametes sanguinea]|uniref:Uncharacterized protein n=1 Tax=Trametes sanguinea TaxID=158606 RepID=A0ACC1P8C4_9APHY|nr:hypothetical protein NUW54_g9289 [Trametes sanguinea]
MSNPPQASGPRTPSVTSPTFRNRPTRTVSTGARPLTRRPSVSGVTLTNPVTGAAKTQRTSKTTQKLVVLPSAPQTKPPPAIEEDEEQLHGYETDQGIRDHKSAGERMSKEEREKAGFRRITAYCIAEGFKMKLLASFLKREHNVKPRIYDEAMYVMYHLPLLPGYGPGSNIRSSAPAVTPGREDPSSGLSEAEEDGYQGTYFNSAAPHEEPTTSGIEGYMPSASPVTATHGLPAESPGPIESAALNQARASQQVRVVVDAEEREHEPPKSEVMRPRRVSRRKAVEEEENFAEAIFFEYGVVVFYGFREDQELGIIEDVEEAGILTRRIPHDDWEVEACHYAHDPNIAFPRIFNDFFSEPTGASLGTLDSEN